MDVHIFRKSKKDGAGRRDVELRIADVLIKPGYYIYCDLDGIVVSNKRLV